MRIVNVIQGSEEWDKLRCGIPTASNFDRIITPAKAELSASWPKYATELLGEEMGVIVPAPPTFWMQWGTDHQPYAFAAYTAFTGRDSAEVGFVWPDDHKRYGCSPDRLVGDNGLLEVKCPMPETVIGYHAKGVFPLEYKPQVMGQLWITGRDWCDFMAYHPQLKPFLVRVERDDKYIANLAVALDEFCEHLDVMREKLRGIDQAIEVSVSDDYQPTTYQSSEVAL